MEKKEIPRVAPARPVAFITDNTRLKRKMDVSEAAGGFPNSQVFFVSELPLDSLGFV